MKASEFWKPVIVSLVATPVFLLLGIASAGAGHGNYFLAIILFPFTMLSAVVFNSITTPFMLLAVAQFPLYGVSFGAARLRGKAVPLAIGLFVAHVAVATLCFLL